MQFLSGGHRQYVRFMPICFPAQASKADAATMPLTGRMYYEFLVPEQNDQHFDLHQEKCIPRSHKRGKNTVYTIICQTSNRFLNVLSAESAFKTKLGQTMLVSLLIIVLRKAQRLRQGGLFWPPVHTYAGTLGITASIRLRVHGLGRSHWKVGARQHVLKRCLMGDELDRTVRRDEGTAYSDTPVGGNRHYFRTAWCAGTTSSTR